MPEHHPLPGWPVEAPYSPTGPAPVRAAAVELYRPAQPVVYIPGPGGQMVAVLAEHYTRPIDAPPPVTPVPARDPWPARLVAGGIAVSTPLAVAGAFADQLATLTAPALAVTGLALAIGYASRGARRQQAGGGGPVNVTVNNHPR